MVFVAPLQLIVHTSKMLFVIMYEIMRNKQHNNVIVFY